MSMPELHPGEEVYLHVRHFSPRYNTRNRHLDVFVWFDDGTKQLVKVTNRFEGLRTKFHLISAKFALKGPIAYLQIAKQEHMFQIFTAPDVFIRDCAVKRDADPDASRGEVLSFFQFQGFLRGRHVAIKNTLYTGSKVNLAFIRADLSNKNDIVDDVLVPRLHWASDFIVYDKLMQKERVIVDAGGIRALFQTNSLSMFFNYVLLLELDTNRYLGTPGFASFPTPDFAFSDTKGDAFLGSNMGKLPLAAAEAYVSSLPRAERRKSYAYSKVDFSNFLLTERQVNKREEMREAEAMQHIVAHHAEDTEFGRLFLESLFCSQLQRRTTNTKPETLQWLDALAHESGYEATKDVFFADFSGLVGVPRNEKLGWFAPARIVFQLDQEDRLKPIGIALYYTESALWQTHLPAYNTWAVAKLFAKCAAAQDHEIVQHALNTHIILEPFAIALEQKVPLDHFVYRLLKQHFRYTIDVNFKARTALINAGGLFDQFIATGGSQDGHIKYMAKLYDTWEMRFMDFESDMEARGFDKTYKMPGYLYAEDAKALWDAIFEYVDTTTKITYPTEQDYAADRVTRNYFMEVQTSGFPTLGNIIPETRQAFVQACTSVIFNASVQHAAVNFPQFTHYSYIVNAPLLLIKEPPPPNQQHDNVTVDDYLPNKTEALKAIATVWGLSRFTRGDERYMYYHEDSFFNLSFWNDSKFRAACNQLQHTMGALERKIEDRAPSKYGTTYRWLLPSLIPTSVAT